MRFKSDREKREVLEKVRKGIPILKWEVMPYLQWSTRQDDIYARHGDLLFEIYASTGYETTSQIILYLGDYYARNKRGRFILKRDIDINDLNEWMRRADELLFYILTGKVHVESGPHPKNKKDKKYYDEDRKDIYDDLLKTFRSKR